MTQNSETGPRLWTQHGFIEDEWRHHAEGDLPAGRLILPLALYLGLAEDVQRKEAERLGVLVTPADDIATLAEHLSDVPLVALSFPAFSDGRSYSRAALLRTRYRYKGELRAAGDVLIDQIPLMLRIGFDTMEVANETALRRLEQGRVGGIANHSQPSTQPEAPGPRYSWRRTPAAA